MLDACKGVMAGSWSCSIVMALSWLILVRTHLAVCSTGLLCSGPEAMKTGSLSSLRVGLGRVVGWRKETKRPRVELEAAATAHRVVAVGNLVVQLVTEAVLEPCGRSQASKGSKGSATGRRDKRQPRSQSPAKYRRVTSSGGMTHGGAATKMSNEVAGRGARGCGAGAHQGECR